MIAQIVAWWIPLAIGAAIGVAVMAIIADGRIGRMEGRHLKEREVHLEIINKQMAEISSLKFYAEFKRKAEKKDPGPGEPKP